MGDGGWGRELPADVLGQTLIPQLSSRTLKQQRVWVCLCATMEIFKFL